MFCNQFGGNPAVGQCCRIWKWCFAGVAVFILLQSAMSYSGISHVKWAPVMWANKIVLRRNLYIMQNTLDHPCDRLLRTVHFNGSDDKTQAFDVGGCPLDNITGRGALQCLNDTATTYIMFIGDSRVRQLRDYFWKILADEPKVPSQQYHSDKKVVKENVTLEFLWRTHATLDKLFKRILKSPKKPDVLLVGTGVWRARESNGTTEGLLQYERVLRDTLVPLKELAANHSHVFWIPQDPVAEDLLDERRRMLSTKLMDSYNSVAYKLMNNSDIHIWESSRSAAYHFPGHHRDCVHFKTIVDQHKTQILLNWLCNHKKEKVKCCV